MGVDVSELRGEQGWTELPSEAGSLAELVAGEPANGVYLVARSWQGGRVLELDRHFDRLERSALALGHTLHVPRAALRRQLAARRLVRGWPDVRFRITAILDPEPWWRLSLEQASDLPQALRRDGVACASLAHGGRVQPEIKATAWLHDRARLERAANARSDIYETLLTDGAGRILEGVSSNFYAIVQGELCTAGSGVLAGIARRIVLEVASGLLPVRLEAPRLADLGPGCEAFITSATRGVVPVNSIDDRVFGPPGPWTLRLMQSYDDWLSAHLEPLLPAQAP